jgi:HPr kinase/phosphorylase
MEQEIPRKSIPVRPGRNLTAIVEVAARDYLLKQRGYHAAREFERKLLKNLKKRG